MLNRGAFLLIFLATAASASPDRMVRVQVTFKRTVTETGTVTEANACGSMKRSQMTFTESVSIGSEAFPMSDDTDEISLDVPTDPMPAGAKPLTGQGSFDYQIQTDSKFCDTTSSSHLRAHSDLDIAKLYFSLRYSRQSTQGELSLSPGFGPSKGAGTIKVHAPPNADQTVDGGQVAGSSADSFAASMANANLSTAAQWAVLGPSAVALKQAMGRLAQDNDLTVAKTSTGFQIGFHESREFPIDKLNPPTATEKKVGSRTITTDLVVSIGGQPETYEAILEPIASVPGAQLATYSKFVPIGPHPGAKDGKLDTVAFRVYLVKKANPGERVTNVPFQVRYALESSHEPGYSINMPENGKADNDLVWHPLVAKLSGVQQLTDTTLTTTPDQGAFVMAMVQSKDFGAYGKLRAHVQLKTGEGLDAHLAGANVPDAKIPLDDNDNHIADAWEHAEQLTDIDATSDKEHFDGNNFDGDGLTLYEEYRGAVVNGTHVRLDPKKKDLFLLNKTGNDLGAAAAIFEAAAAPAVDVHVCIDGELPKDTHLVNANSSFARGGGQHGVVAYNKPTPTPGGIAETVPDKPPGGSDMASRAAARDHTAASPGHVIELDIDYKAAAEAAKTQSARSVAANQAYAAAHELGHAVGIHHHGDRSEDVGVYKSFVAAGTAYLVDLDGKPRAWPTNDPNMDLARSPSEASGDLHCIMAYNNLYDYAYTDHHAAEFPLLVDGLKRHGVTLYEQRPVLVYIGKKPRPEGTKLCRSNAGTDINVKTATRPSVFGDGKKDCWSQLRIKDW